jgi:hypothetical protein
MWQSGKERRTNPRFHCCGNAEVHLPEDKTSYYAKILDLSLQGCQVQLLEAVNLANNIDILDLVFTVNGLPFFVRGHVQYIRNETRIGIHFMQLSSRAHGQLVDLLAELEECAVKQQQMAAKIAS